MQEQSKTPPQPKLSKTEAINKPNYRRFNIQGEDRFIATVHQETEKRTAAGILIPVNCQTIPTTGRVVAMSPISEENKTRYSVKVGDNIQVVPNSWTTLEIDGELIATGILEYIVATYDFPEDEKSLDAVNNKTEDEQREALDRMRVENLTFTGSPKSVSSLIRVR